MFSTDNKSSRIIRTSPLTMPNSAVLDVVCSRGLFLSLWVVPALVVAAMTLVVSLAAVVVVLDGHDGVCNRAVDELLPIKMQATLRDMYTATVNNEPMKNKCYRGILLVLSSSLPVLVSTSVC